MNIIHTDAYRTAFVEYLRRGTPIRLSLKDTGVKDRYVWRTQRDERVRPSHRMNDGRIFSWSDPPDTGDPGEDYNVAVRPFPLSRGRPSLHFLIWRPTLTHQSILGKTTISSGTSLPVRVVG